MGPLMACTPMPRARSPIQPTGTDVSNFLGGPSRNRSKKELKVAFGERLTDVTSAYTHSSDGGPVEIPQVSLLRTPWRSLIFGPIPSFCVSVGQVVTEGGAVLQSLSFANASERRLMAASPRRDHGGSRDLPRRPSGAVLGLSSWCRCVDHQVECGQGVRRAPPARAELDAICPVADQTPIGLRPREVSSGRRVTSQTCDYRLVRTLTMQKILAEPVRYILAWHRTLASASMESSADRR